ncbi:MAG: leucine-rich repeat protein [Lachnospiraceae bacterium]|nr:leucine-rich repeat protein [Lachnospiraceae bacterium]
MHYDYGDRGPFYKCEALKEAVMGDGMEKIPTRLFQDSGVEKIRWPEGVKEIGDSAFENCEGLTSAEIPGSVQTIGRNSFTNCNKLVLYVTPNSYAAMYAINNNIPFHFISDEIDNGNYVINMDNSSYYTNSSISQVNSYVPLTLNYEIKKDEISNVSNGKIMIGLAKNLEIISGTVSVNGKKMTDYTYDNNILMIPTNDSKGKIQLSVKPLEEGMIATYAYFSYKKNAVQAEDIIGTLSLEVPVLTIEAPSETSEKTFRVSGVTGKQKKVRLYLNDEKVNSVTSKKDGTYTTDVSLPDDAKNKSNYIIKATLDDDEKISFSTKIQYNEATPVLTQFDMYYMAHSGQKLDLLSVLGQKQNIYFAPGNTFTFKIKFKNADRINTVNVTSTKNGIVKKLKAKPTNNEGEYIASGYFDEKNKNYVPGTINVEYSLNPSIDNMEKDVDESDFPDVLKNSKVNIITDSEEEYLAEIIAENDEKITFHYEEESEKEVQDELYNIFGIKKSDSSNKNKQQKSMKTSILEGDSDEDWNEIKDFLKDYGKEFKDNILAVGDDGFVILNQNLDTIIYYTWDVAKSSFMKVGIKYSVKWKLEEYYEEAMMYRSEDYIAAEAALSIAIAKAFHDDFEEINKMLDVEYNIKHDSDLTKEEKESELDRYQHVKDAYAVNEIFRVVVPLVKFGLTVSGHPAAAAVSGILFSEIEKLYEGKLEGYEAYYEAGGQGTFISWLIDPSGYVYEAVPSNRVSRVKATAYYKENKDDIPVVWNASEYSQANPMHTDTAGCYAWDVPEGYWQVKYEKDGYETVYSDWMEVPPPQTDVNIAMVSKVAPAVDWINVYSDSIQVKFSQYMIPDTVNNIILKDSKNNKIEYNLSYTKDEKNSDGVILADQYTLKLANKSLEDGELCILQMKDTIKNYANISLSDGTFTEKCHKKYAMFVPETEALDYGEEKTIKVKVSGGNEISLKAVSNFDDIVKVITVKKSDETNIWDIVLKGCMSGETNIDIELEKTDLITHMAVKVKMPLVEESSQHKHVWDSGKVTKNATCTQKGVKLYTCDCGKTKTEDIPIDLSNHTFKVVIDKKATCGSDGKQHRECIKCNYKEKTVVIPAKGNHSYGAYSITKEATVLTSGIKTRICSVCGNKNTAIINKLKPTIKLNVTSIILKKKQSTTKVIVSNLAKGDKIKSWKSSNTKVVKVSNKGKITAQNKVGNATITITLLSGKMSKLKVKVQNDSVKTTKISGLSKSIVIKKSKKFALKPVIMPITSVQKITYKSSNKKIATVSSKGIITGKKKGKAKITVKSGSKKFVVSITVK